MDNIIKETNALQTNTRTYSQLKLLKGPHTHVSQLWALGTFVLCTLHLAVIQDHLTFSNNVHEMRERELKRNTAND